MLELDVVSAPLFEAAFECRPETGQGAVAGCAVTVGVLLAGPGAAAGSGSEPAFDFVPVEGERRPVGAVPEDSTMPPNHPAPDMAPRTPSGTGVVGPVAVVGTDAELLVEAAF